jgi:hypothetical protein
VNAVSHLFPKSSKPEFNIRIGPAFARANQGFEVGARTNASHEGKPRQSSTQEYESPGLIQKFKCSLSASVISLKDEVKQIRENLTVSGIPSRPSTPKPQRVAKHSSM